MWGKVFPEHKMQILAVSSLYEASIQVICWKRFVHILISNIRVSRRILLPKCSLHHARPIFTLCTLRAPCSEAKRGVLGSKSSDIYVLGISEKNLKKWAYFGPNLRTFLKKIFFHPRVPPLCFEPFWTICPARFRKWQGVNLKIGISSFHRSFSFCYKQIAW